MSDQTVDQSEAAFQHQSKGGLSPEEIQSYYVKPVYKHKPVHHDRLAGKSAVVTGSGNGIARAIALMFAREGAKVYGCDIDVKASEEVVKIAKAEGLTYASMHPCDISDPKAAQRLMETAAKAHGGIDILVNGAAWGAFAWIEEMDLEAWNRTLTGELTSVFIATKAAWPYLKTSGAGSIINFASANAHEAYKPLPALAHCAGKGGVLAMTRQLAAEGGKHNIRANTISPCLTVTAATKFPIENIPGMASGFLEKAMIRRLGWPEDAGWLAIFLASEESSWITATDVNLDSGSTKW